MGIAFFYALTVCHLELNLVDFLSFKGERSQNPESILLVTKNVSALMQIMERVVITVSTFSVIKLKLNEVIEKWTSTST